MHREKAINRSHETVEVIREKKMNSRNELVATEIIMKWIINLNAKGKTVKILEENIRE